jgi:penicillin-binding protein 1A
MMRSYQRTYLRKIQEILLAFQLERQLSKEQIFELYVNNIYFGPGIYGVQAACRRFWNKSCTEITVAQAATLAAVAASVNLFSPLHAPAGAVNRRNVILKSMEKLGYITAKEYREASQEPLNMYTMATMQIRHYLIEWIRAWAEERWGREAVYHNGLSIMTTINSKMQEKAEVTFKKYLPLLRKKMGDALNGGMITLESSTGYIKAMIGGYSFKESQFNRALQARRPMGSSFKPYLYASALQSGMSPDTVFVDEPLTVTMPNGVTWSPQNWTGDFDGEMTLVRALSLSNNIIAIKLFLTLGATSVAAWAHRFCIDLQNQYPSNALGTCEVSVEQNAAAFNVFANNGVYVKPLLISTVRDKNGHVLFKGRQERHRVLDSKINAQMINMLSWKMIIAKTLHPDRTWFDGESIGKTGATNGASTAWFVGATPEYTTALYLGRDDNKTLGKWVFASDTAFPIWLDFYNGIKLTKKHFFIDPSLQEHRINWISGEKVSEGTILDNVATILK